MRCDVNMENLEFYSQDIHLFNLGTVQKMKNTKLLVHEITII